MNLFNRKNRIGEQSGSAKEELYSLLSAKKYTSYPYERRSLGEGMIIVNAVIGQYWKPRFLLDTNTHRACEFMNAHEQLLTVTADDIDWQRVDLLEGAYMAHQLSAHYPTFIYNFKNGVAQVSWQLNPDGRYFMDDDGFGMTDDEEITIYGYIDTECNVLVKFQPINDYKELDILRLQAEKTTGTQTAR